MERQYNLIDVLSVLFAWRKPIIRTCVAIGVGTAIISLFLPNFYQAKTSFLAASPDRSQPELFFNKSGVRTYVYGTDGDMDRLLTLAQSADLVNYMVEKFDLYNHYEIDTSNIKASYRVKRKFFKYYAVEKTDKDALVLSFEDKDPAFAAQVCNEARDKINSIAQELLKKRQRSAVSALENNINNKRNQLLQLSDTLQVLRKEFGIYNADAQTEKLSELYDRLTSKLVNSVGRYDLMKGMKGIKRDTIRLLEVEIKGTQDQIDTLESRLNKINRGLPEIEVFATQYKEANESLSEDMEQLKQYNTVLNADLPALIVVETAETPVVKSRPRRSIIVIAAGMITFIFSVIGVLLFDAYQDMEWEKIFVKNETVKTQTVPKKEVAGLK